MNEVTLIEISNVPTLDPIDVYFKDCESGKGHITITCYGLAWTSYFGAMGNRTIRQFVSDASVDYLTNKMSMPKSKKRDVVYLARIISAVKQRLLDQP
jgi:hypothetical protein